MTHPESSTVGRYEPVPWLQQARAFTERTLRELFRSKVALFWSVGWPLFWYLLTTRLFLPVPESIPPGEVATYLAQVKAANAVSYGVFGAATVSLVTFAHAFADDLESKRYRTFRSLPIAPSADLAGRFVAGFALAVVAFVGVLVVGLLDGAALSIRSPLTLPVVLGSLLLFCLAAMAVALVLTLVVQAGEYVTAITTSVLMVSFFLTGFNGTVPSMLPESVRWVVNVAPNALATRLQLYFLTDVAADGNAMAPPALPTGAEPLALLVGFAVVFGGAGVLTVRHFVYRGEGGE
ncbi:ABC transporter permease [Haloarchaeobius sp. DT45]|uniref:ABC transporter permease n=1 Tax=Haloarchaeobius sp. DT45 TaxID=3446116 RepID=UPI003F6AB141